MALDCGKLMASLPGLIDSLGDRLPPYDALPCIPLGFHPSRDATIPLHFWNAAAPRAQYYNAVWDDSAVKRVLSKQFTPLLDKKVSETLHSELLDLGPGRIVEITEDEV